MKLVCGEPWDRVATASIDGEVDRNVRGPLHAGLNQLRLQSGAARQHQPNEYEAHALKHRPDNRKPDDEGFRATFDDPSGFANVWAHAMTTSTDDRVVFAVSFESMFSRALGPELPRALRHVLSEIKVDLKNLQAAYPLKTWSTALEAARRACYPGRSDAEAYEELGRVFIRSYFETFIGRTVKPLLKVLGTSRSLERMRQNFRGGNNFSDSRLEKTGDRSCRLHMNHDLGHPSFVLGIIHEGMTLAVDPTFRMSVVETQPPAVTYVCSWG
jgi:uncharacterized protein (TIGR02265 family)